MSEMTSLRRAALEIGAVNLGDGWAHRDDGTRRWYRVSEAQLEDLGVMLAAGTPDAYSRWCADSTAVEMPAEWQP